jgi:hypothetical protein
MRSHSSASAAPIRRKALNSGCPGSVTLAQQRCATSSWCNPTQPEDHPAGIDNPNRFFVFAVDFSDLPNNEAQQLAKILQAPGCTHHSRGRTALSRRYAITRSAMRRG